MSVVSERDWNGYKIAVGGVHLNDDDDIDEYTCWVTAPDGTPVVFEAEVYGRESAVFRWGEDQASEHQDGQQEGEDEKDR